MITNDELLNEIADEGKYTFIATGMSTYEEIDHAVMIFRDKGCPFELMHCNSTYPMPEGDVNLKLIKVFADRYSGHEAGTFVSIMAVAEGATSIERLKRK